jgi:hypothetical protein
MIPQSYRSSDESKTPAVLLRPPDKVVLPYRTGMWRKQEGLCLLSTCACWTEVGAHGQDKEVTMFAVLSEVPLITINLGNMHLALYLSQVMYGP